MNDTIRLFLHLHQPPDIHTAAGRVVINSDAATVFVDPAIVRRMSAQLMIAADDLERQVAL